MSRSRAHTWKTLPLAVAIVLSVASVYFVARLGGVFFLHAEALWRHAWSGRSWEVVPLDESLKLYFATIYRRPDVEVHLVAGTSFAFPFDAESRRATVQYIGHRVPIDAPSLSFQDASLHSTYRDYLYDKLRAASMQPGESAWHRLLTSLQTELTSLNLQQKIELRRNARMLEHAVNTDSQLANALSKFDVGNMFLRSDMLSLEVYTEPPYDRIDDHREILVKPTGVPESVCLANVGEIGSQVEGVVAQASLYPQFAELRIVRPWLDDNVLDQHADLTPQQKQQFFGENGSLRAIPTSIVLGAGDELQIVLQRIEDAEKVRSLVRRNTCCEVTCNGAALVLKPDSVSSAGGLQYKGLVDRPVPIVLAIVSTRRSP